MSKSLAGLIELGKSQEGYIEKASDFNLDSKTANKGDKNYQKFSRDINSVGLKGYQGQAWCCSFQFWLDLTTFGVKKALELWRMTPSSYVGYNCFATYNIFARAKLVGKTPRLGALVIFNFSHAGRVIKIYNQKGITYFDCLEGNTSANLNDRNGGQVKIKKRPANDPTIKGFCYIDYGQFEVKKSGWEKQDDGWHFYLGDTGECVKNNWYQDSTGRWSWFNAAGCAIQNAWYKYNSSWFWFRDDAYMAESEWIEYKGNHYYLTSDGSMAKSAYIKSKDVNSNMYYWVNANGVWESKWNTTTPDLDNCNLVE